LDSICGSISAAIGCDVVRAEHHHDDLGFEALKLAILHAPEDMLSAVGIDAEVGGLERCEGAVPNRLAAARAGSGSPEIGDGIADEQDINVALFGDIEKGIVTRSAGAL